MVNLPFLLFLTSKAYVSVPINNILIKLNNIGIRDKCFQFITNLYLNLYLTSKVPTSFNVIRLKEFPIHRCAH
jgi:hypothetical protein